MDGSLLLLLLLLLRLSLLCRCLSFVSFFPSFLIWRLHREWVGGSVLFSLSLFFPSLFRCRCSCWCSYLWVLYNELLNLGQLLAIAFKFIQYFHLFCVECHQANEQRNHNKFVNLFAQFKFDTLHRAHAHTNTHSLGSWRYWCTIWTSPGTMKDELDRPTTLLHSKRSILTTENHCVVCSLFISISFRVISRWFSCALSKPCVNAFRVQCISFPLEKYTKESTEHRHWLFYWIARSLKPLFLSTVPNRVTILFFVFYSFERL